MNLIHNGRFNADFHTFSNGVSHSRFLLHGFRGGTPAGARIEPGPGIGENIGPDVGRVP